MDQYTDKPFPQAVGDLLRERYGDAMGRYPLAPFINQIEEKTGLTYEYIRLMLRDERTLRTDVIEAVSSIFAIEPTYFIEYRQLWIKAQMERFPALVNKLFEIAWKFVKQAEMQPA